MNKTQLMKRTVAIGIVVAIAFGQTIPSFAAPVLSSTAIVKNTAPSMIDQVRVVRSNRGLPISAGIALGVISTIVGAVAAQNNPYYYGPGNYDPGYYGPGYYGPGYPAAVYVEPAPVYVAPPMIYAPAPAYVVPQPELRYGPRQCWITTDRDRGFGYWSPC